MTKKKIMIIDDDIEFLGEITETLKENSCEVESFSDGNEALKRINELIPDVVLLDLKMKNLSGFQIADLLKSSSEFIHAPIIAMTGYYTRDEDSMLMSVCGIEKYLLKPFNVDKLMEEIEKVINGETPKNIKRKNIVL